MLFRSHHPLERHARASAEIPDLLGYSSLRFRASQIERQSPTTERAPLDIVMTRARTQFNTLLTGEETDHTYIKEAILTLIDPSPLLHLAECEQSRITWGRAQLMLARDISTLPHALPLDKEIVDGIKKRLSTALINGWYEELSLLSELLPQKHLNDPDIGSAIQNYIRRETPRALSRGWSISGFFNNPVFRPHLASIAADEELAKSISHETQRLASSGRFYPAMFEELSVLFPHVLLPDLNQSAYHALERVLQEEDCRGLLPFLAVRPSPLLIVGQKKMGEILEWLIRTGGGTTALPGMAIGQLADGVLGQEWIASTDRIPVFKEAINNLLVQPYSLVRMAQIIELIPPSLYQEILTPTIRGMLNNYIEAEGMRVTDFVDSVSDQFVTVSRFIAAGFYRAGARLVEITEGRSQTAYDYLSNYLPETDQTMKGVPRRQVSGLRAPFSVESVLAYELRGTDWRNTGCARYIALERAPFENQRMGLGALINLTEQRRDIVEYYRVRSDVLIDLAKVPEEDPQILKLRYENAMQYALRFLRWNDVLLAEVFNDYAVWKEHQLGYRAPGIDLLYTLSESAKRSPDPTVEEERLRALAFIYEDKENTLGEVLPTDTASSLARNARELRERLKNFSRIV